MALVDVNLVVLVLCVMAIQKNGMGVPASPSGVFRLRFAPVPPKKAGGTSLQPPNARGPVQLSVLYPRSTWGGFEVPFGRSLPTGRDRPQVHFLESTTEKSPDATCGAVQADTPLRYVTAFKSTFLKSATKKHACHVWC